MSYVTDILPRIVDILKSVGGIGVVSSYPRHSAFVETHRDYFVASDGKLRGWIVDRNAAPSTGAPGNQVFRQHNISFTGYWALKESDKSSNDFQAEIDAILTAFDEVVYLAGTDINQISTPQLISKTEEMFGGVLCHKCEIIVVMTEETTP
jgi:hypothetical protein